MPSAADKSDRQQQGQRQPRRRRRLPRTPLLLAAIAAAVYANTLTAQFTFDDSFAIIYNGDVTDDRKPLRALLTNDFWGQQLRSPMSHKSYRPLTVLSFRLQHRLGRALLGEWKEEASRVPLPHNLAPGGGGSGSSSRPLMGDQQQRQGHTINPLTFHAFNVAAHAGVTVLVYRLGRRLAAARSRAGGAGGVVGGSSGGTGGSSSSSNGYVGSFDWAAFSLEPFLAALLFALHPVHTEAVAGVVGHAELLCAALSIPALLCYMAAADGRVASPRAYWGRLAAAVVLGWAAALTKEIGITIMGAMVCYDVLVAPLFPQPLRRLFPGRHARRLPHMPAAHPLKQQQQQQPPAQQPPQPKAAGSTASGRHRGASPAAVAAAATELLQQVAAVANGGSGGDAYQPDPAARRQALRLKLQRILVTALAVLLYVKTRSWLAGDQLVRIYRKVENPIPFAASSLTRKLTTGYLHARYAGLLLAPLQLSADWSYACIEYVSSLADPRNLATLALYAALAYVGLAARPWHVLQEWSGICEQAPSAADRSARWRLAVAAGLLVGPFFPASNVLFYVGTFIGERLLYFPSVGFCLLLAEPLAAALRPLLPQPASSGSSSSSGSDNGAAPSRAQRGRAVGTALLLAGLLGFYAVRTVVRNNDWWDEERLFRAAQKVCWRSGKVQLNSGIIERRYQNWEKAEAHFRLAREADPDGFCEPDFHIGLTLLNRNLTLAVEYLEKGVACKYTAADAVKGLNQIFQQLLDSTPEHTPEVLERWGSVLARPHLQRYTEAATYYESAAFKARSPLQAVLVINRGQSMLTEAAQSAVPIGRTPDFPVRVPADTQVLERLARCMAARRPVILTAVGTGVTTDGLATQPVKQAAYSYLAQHGEDCRQPIPAPDAAGEEAAARSSTFHTGLLHALQQSDVNDPWLQQEWGFMLVASGRTQEALAHLEVAGHIFAAQLLPPSQAADKSLRHVTVLDATGARPIREAEAGEAAVAAYRRALHAVDTLSAEPGMVVDLAAKKQVVCRLLQQVRGVLQVRHAQNGPELANNLAELQQAGCTADGASGGGSSSSTSPGQPSDRDEL